ncbi:MAG: extracellular solute-binding protein [Muricomes sp.]|uniref:extracellular solute-binding protein n=1 Tax=Faecalicatena contorta TaxID=39482 RepID=UPI002EA959E2|nr:extracellular solute-binding protein [Muricomes sp.]
MATLKDVARDAGVSIATVSCCLSGAKNVKPETRARIMDSIEKLKYIPNASARNLKTADSKKIGIVLTDIDDYYHAEIFKGISSYLQNKGFSMNVAFSNNSPDIECDKIDDFVSGNVSGLLIITSQPQNTEFFTARIRNYNIPAVFIERRPDNLNTSFVSFDNSKTTYYLTENLIKKGYHNIALITGSQQFSSEAEAIKGYQLALQDYELPVNPDLIRTTNLTREDGFKAFLTLPLLDQIDAVITTSENIAQGVAEACKIQGSIPSDDIQILTFGEESWNRVNLSGIIHTSRTAFTLGTKAAQLLMQNIESPVLFEEKTLIFTDEIIHSRLPLPEAKKKNPASKKAGSSKEPLRILMADLATSHAARLLSENFTRQTGNPVEIDFAAQNELPGKIVEDLGRSRSHYDIYMYDIPWLQYLVQNGLIADITDFIESDSFNSDAFFPENLNNCMFDKRYYGIPIVGGSQILFYRQDLFENRRIQKDFKKMFQIPLSPPRTWTEFNGIASFFTRDCNPDSPTQYGTSMAGIVDEELAPEILIRLWSGGGKLWDKYNRVCMNTPENAQAFGSILKTLNYIETSPFETDISKTVHDFCSGKTAMLITYSEYAGQICQSIHNNIIGRVGYESIPGKTPASVGWNLGMNPCTARYEEACLYFQWLSKKDISIYMTILDGQSPARAPYSSHELLKLYPWLELTEKSFEYCRKRTGPYSKNSLIIPQSRIETTLCTVLRRIVTDGLGIAEALDEGQKEMQALFKSYGYPKPLHLLP